MHSIDDVLVCSYLFMVAAELSIHSHLSLISDPENTHTGHEINRYRIL